MPTASSRSMTGSITLLAASVLLAGCAGADRPAVMVVSGGGASDAPRPGVSTIHRTMLENIDRRGPLAGPGLSVCFTPDTPSDVVQAFNDRIFLQAPAFNQANRWGATALDPAGGAPGAPTTITYSFVPDGTPIDGFNGEPAAPSQLFADLNALYGSPAAWQPLFHGVFQRWGQLIGIRYVYEPHDDGVPLASADGLAGVRGDVRISGHPIDGNSGVLAYNFYPPVGDMVVETSDNFFAQTFGDSIRLRNVVSHEHGHGMGQAHVCPITQSKLMEPFISVAYDGPREDDIRNGQSLYGDPFEPDNSPASARNLGSLSAEGSLTIGPPPPPDAPFASLLSIDAPGEEDWVTFTINAPTVLRATATPVGRTYEDAPQACAGQSGSCCSGTFTNSITAANLAIRIVAPNGAAVLADASSQPAGAPETATATLAPGVYFVRVYETGVTAPPQMYNLTLETQSAAFTASLVGDPPAAIAPGAATTLQVQVISGQQSLNVAASSLLFRTSSGAAFASTPLTALGAGLYAAVLPGFPCGSTPEYAFSLVGSAGAVVSLPSTAPAINFTSYVGAINTIFADDMEIDRGWTVGPTTAVTGAWVRVDPIGTAAAPEDDHTPGSGVAAWVTAQGSPGGAVGEQDVDGGFTTLVSPRFDVSTGGEVTISYFRWFSSGAGSGPYSDIFRIEATNNDGATWVPAETVGPGGPADPNTNPGWIPASFTLAAIGLSPTDRVRIRFIAQDLGVGSVIEAGVDDVLVLQRLCVQPPCAADFNSDGFVDPDDLSDYIGCFFTPPCPRSDFNADGVTDPDDLSDFIGTFFGGC